MSALVVALSGSSLGINGENLSFGLKTNVRHERLRRGLPGHFTLPACLLMFKQSSPLKDGLHASEVASKRSRRVMQVSQTLHNISGLDCANPTQLCSLRLTPGLTRLLVSFHCSLHTLGDYLHSRRCAQSPQSFKEFKMKPNIKRPEDLSSYKLLFKDIFKSLNILLTWRQKITFFFFLTLQLINLCYQRK